MRCFRFPGIFGTTTNPKFWSPTITSIYVGRIFGMLHHYMKIRKLIVLRSEKSMALPNFSQEHRFFEEWRFFFFLWGLLPGFAEPSRSHSASTPSPLYFHKATTLKTLSAPKARKFLLGSRDFHYSYLFLKPFWNIFGENYFVGT